MPAIWWKDERLDAIEGESVLETLLRHDQDVAYGCRSGRCGACRMRAEDGEFLSCQRRPDGDLRILDGREAPWSAAEVVELRLVGEEVMLLRLAPPEGFDYVPGQYLQLRRPGDVVRSYSLASLPREGWLELHVRRVPEGSMSSWIFGQLREGDEVEMRGPFGECHYVPGRPDQPLVLAGVGTGLAPLYGIARDALERGHQGPVVLWRGAREAGRLYYAREVAALASRWPNFETRACVGESGGSPEVSTGSLADLVTGQLPPGSRAFLCGAPRFVHDLRRRLFLQGLAMKDILADPFEPAPATT